MYQTLSNIDSMKWEPSGFAGVHFKVLGGEPATGSSVVVYRFDAGSSVPAHWHTVADETAYVLEGEFIEDGERFPPGSVLTGLAGTVHGPHNSKTGCTVLFALSRELDFIAVD